ncbi:hypothetical protein ACWDBD_38780 [Streptomyces sp. NPDC001118]|uniref:hypothetical protein n=1 Tax=Streptomyces sp. NPDC001127 TaxID=3154377 RepID=UPI0033275E2A
MTLSFEEFPEPKRWTSDGGRLHWSADGDVVVTCSEHGEVGRVLSDSYLAKEHPWIERNAVLAQDNHLWFEHGIAQGHHSR